MSDTNKPSLKEERQIARERRARREERQRIRHRQRQIRVGILIGTIVVVLCTIIGITIAAVKSGQAKKAEEKAAKEAQIAAEEAEFAARKDAVAKADLMAAGYDYDGAIDLLQSIDGYENDKDMAEAIARYTAAKTTLVQVDLSEVTHVFYHSLVVDPARGFTGENASGFNAWMTTLDEFTKITQQMYDRGYVLIRLRDMVNETVDEDGTVHFTNAKIMLPEGKKAYVLSVDDLSYYHSYDGHGVASKIVLDENGLPKCEYTDANGTTTVGDYDVVPALNTFLEAHPDGAYKGARGTIALTGYNGVFGYRTDACYRDRTDLSDDQQAWLDANPNFNYDQDVADATKVADAIKATGWEFASHTWGHLRVGDSSLETLQTDTDKWFNTVVPIIGEVDTIIFAHGQDLGDWHDYSTDNEKFTYFKSRGFNFFCNVDSTQYWSQIRDNYVRMGRRNLDGYLMYKSMTVNDNLEDLFHVADVFDTTRPTPVTLS